MKLKKLALISEILSGIAVVVTLIFLVIGIRDNTNIIQAATYQDLLFGINDFNFSLINDAELARLWAGRLNRSLGEMEPDDAIRLVYINRLVYRINDAAYFSFRNGSLNEDQWERFRQNICAPHIERDSTYDELWSRTRQFASPEFISYLESGCVN